MTFNRLAVVPANRISTTPVVYRCFMETRIGLLHLQRVDLLLPAAEPGHRHFQPTRLAVDRVQERLALIRQDLVPFYPLAPLSPPAPERLLCPKPPSAVVIARTAPGWVLVIWQWTTTLLPGVKASSGPFLQGFPVTGAETGLWQASVAGRCRGCFNLQAAPGPAFARTRGGFLTITRVDGNRVGVATDPEEAG